MRIEEYSTTVKNEAAADLVYSVVICFSHSRQANATKIKMLIQNEHFQIPFRSRM